MVLPEHCIVGAALANLGLQQRYGAPVTVVMVAASAVPDVDGLLLVTGLESFFRLHRSVTHSLGGILALSAGLALAARLLPSLWQYAGSGLERRGFDVNRAGRTLGLTGRRAKMYGRVGLLFPAAALGMAAHAFADALYPWKVSLLWPFYDTGYCWPVLEWGDRGILAIALAAMFALGLTKKWRPVAAGASLLALGAYVWVSYAWFGWTG